MEDNKDHGDWTQNYEDGKAQEKAELDISHK